MKRAQINQVFVYIFALVVFATIIFFGYRAIQEFIHKGEDITYIKFRNDIQSEVRSIYTNYGEVRVFKKSDALILPAKYSRICLLDKEHPNKDGSGICTSSDADYDPIVCDSWKDKADNVILITPPPTRIISFNIDTKIKVDTNMNQEEDPKDQGYLCITPINGRINLILRGFGDHALISTVR